MILLLYVLGKSLDIHLVGSWECNSKCVDCEMDITVQQNGM
jgi:wyosine [tRNA(Phe)-imidazoG37] synthetase (radical SAM superfamily)